MLLLIMYRCCTTAARVLLNFRGSAGWDCVARCVRGQDGTPTEERTRTNAVAQFGAVSRK